MIPTLSSETLVFATMSQPRTARTRSELRAASNSLTPTSIRACSGATPREVIFNLSTICSEETLGLFESSCARTRPTPPNPTRATFIRTASGWGVDMPFGPIFSDVIFSSGPLARVRAIVDLGRPTLRGRGTAGPKAYLCPRDGVSRDWRALEPTETTESSDEGALEPRSLTRRRFLKLAAGAGAIAGVL